MNTGKAVMSKVKDCKHSVPFKTESFDAPVSTIYISRTHPLSKGETVLQTWTEQAITFTQEAK